MTLTRYRRLPALLGAVALVLGSVLLVASPAQAATYEVTDPGDGETTVGTLRWAMTQAEAHPGADIITISFHGPIPAGATPLPHITQALTIVGPGSAAVTLATVGNAFEVSGAVALNISGVSIVAGLNAVNMLAGSDLTLEDVDMTGTGGSGILYAAATAADDVVLTHVTVDGQFSGGSGSGSGGGIRLDLQGGTATLTDVTANDMSEYGMRVDGASSSTLVLAGLTANGNRGDGIEIFVEDGLGSLTGALADHNGAVGLTAGVAGTGELTITGATVTGNALQGLLAESGSAAAGILVAGSTITGNGGGGVSIGTGPEAYPGSFTLQDSTVSGNTSIDPFTGGGVVALLGGATSSVLIERSTISDNDGAFAAITAVGSGTFRLHSSTVSGNTGLAVGAIVAILLAEGDAAVEVVNSTVSGNSGPNGTILILGTQEESVRVTATIANSTIVDNDPGTESPAVIISGVEAAISNSILAGNGDLADLLVDGNASLTIGHSLIQLPDSSADAALAAGIGNLTAIAPGLGPLADNGGPTLTHAPKDDSPVVNAGDPAFSGLTADQRGQNRVVGVLDMGAVELGPRLAATGADAGLPIVGGALLVGAGLVLLVARRRARAGHALR